MKIGPSHSTRTPLAGSFPKHPAKVESTDLESSPPVRETSSLSTPARLASIDPAKLAAVQSDISQGKYVEGEVIVKLKEGQVGVFNDFASEYGGRVIEEFDIPQQIFKSFNGDLVRIKLSDGVTTAEAMAAMAEDDRVIYAESNDYQDDFESEQTPNRPNDLHENLWGFENKGQTGGTAGADASLIEAWKINKGDGSENGPLIAIIDSGADMDHPDLVGNFWVNAGEIPGNGKDDDGNGVIDDVHGYDAGDDDGSPDDSVGHGTHVAGTIAAVGNNGEGVTGVNQQARIMPIKISTGGRITTDGVVRAMLYSAKMGADITNNSWGGSRLNKAIEDAFKANPALHIAAAGNNRTNTDQRPYYPMGFDMPNMIAVGATDHNDRKAGFSNYGKTTVDVTAPGADIWSTKNGGGYRYMSGTSMASPFVAGVAGLIMSEYPEASQSQVKERLILGSDPVEALQNHSISQGRVNAATALEADDIAPGAPHDFIATGTTHNGTQIRWTATGDDKWRGRSSAVELVYSENPITAENFHEATALASPKPGETGHWENVPFQVESEVEDRDFHFAMKLVDNVGNRSEMRTTEVTIPGKPVPPESDGPWN